MRMFAMNYNVNFYSLEAARISFPEAGAPHTFRKSWSEARGGWRAPEQQQWCYCRNASLCSVPEGARASEVCKIIFSVAHSIWIYFFILPYTFMFLVVVCDLVWI